MAKFAPVCPPKVLRHLRDNGLMGDYHLLLAHDVVDKEAEYFELFPPNHGMTVIMDNSVIELGKAVDLQMVARAAQITSATYIVLPDTLQDCEQTLFDCTTAVNVWGAFFEEALDHDWSFMFVPQGNTLREWVYCLETFHEEYHKQVGIWGIPRILTDTPGIETRSKAIQVFQKLCEYERAHLLGFSDNVLDDMMCASMLRPNDGIDSAVPLRIASYGMKMQMSLDVLPPRGHWWDTVEPNDLMLQNMEWMQTILSSDYY